VNVPAKAMLFGEYGALLGGKVLAVTFFKYYFSLELSLTKDPIAPCVIVESQFFANKKISFSLDSFENFHNIQDPNILFFLKLLIPWRMFIHQYHLSIVIKKSFSKSLGFGSSSALICGISLGLWKFFYGKDYFEEIDFWEKIKQSVLNIQSGSGSCYDVAVQIAAIRYAQKEKEAKFWVFQNMLNLPLIEEFYPQSSSRLYGCFLLTHLYADTKCLIQKFNHDKNKREFAKYHSFLAESFIKNSNIENLKFLMYKAIQIAMHQNLLPNQNSKIKNLLSILEQNHIPFKTMGAGFGDCLWVLADEKKLQKCCHVNQTDISFAFENNGK
jgi:mevalonate kinase